MNKTIRKIISLILTVSVGCAMAGCGKDNSAEESMQADQVQTFVYACLAGVSVTGVAKQAGIKFGSKFATKMIEKVPGKVLTKINQKVGFRFITKFGQKGIVNLGELVPGVGAVINGSVDFAETKVIADRAYKMFFDGAFSDS